MLRCGGRSAQTERGSVDRESTLFSYKGSQLGQGPGGCGASGATTTKAKRAAATHPLNTPPAARSPLTYTRRAVPSPFPGVLALPGFGLLSAGH